MSTYVTALASGPFKCLEDSFVSPMTRKTIHLATWAPEDDCKHMGFALKTLKDSLAYLEGLLQIPYPLPKLDILAVPNFEMNAQENFGLVCVGRPQLCKADGDVQITIQSRCCMTPPGVAYQVFDQVVNTVSHEVSHMWFGEYLRPELYPAYIRCR
jgi:aminopeptidase 2